MNERVTDDGYVQHMKHFTSERAAESNDIIAFSVMWKLARIDGSHRGTFRWGETKTLSSFEDAVKRYEARKSSAFQVELWQHDDAGDRIIRHYINLGRYKKLYPNASTDWIYEQDNPPYEIEEELT